MHNTSRKKVFIAGPMGGKPCFGHPEFDRVANALSPYCEVANPAEHDRILYPDIASWDCYAEGGMAELNKMGFDIEVVKRWCFEQILLSDVLVFLPGSDESTGAKAEIAVAEGIGIPVIPADIFIREHLEAVYFMH